RDKLVTGVQTCALPIYARLRARRPAPEDEVHERRVPRRRPLRHNGRGVPIGVAQMSSESSPRANAAGKTVTWCSFSNTCVVRFKIGRASCRERVEMSVG